MVVLANSDMLEVRINSLLADYDRETITNLYQPIIGFQALSLYFTLWSEASVQKVFSFSTHEDLFLRMQMPAGKFVEARKLLEGVGLLKTKLEKTSGASIYHYELQAPKTPMGFFLDTLLYGMLIKNLGEKEAKRLKKVYEAVNLSEDGEDISSSFNDVFHPDFSDPSFLSAAKVDSNVVGRNKAKISTDFSYEKFFTALSSLSQINDKAITKKELKEIERLSSLYGVSEDIAAQVTSNVYDPHKEKGERVDMELLNKGLIDASNYAINRKNNSYGRSRVSSETALAKKIALFEECSPRDMLMILQGGTKVAPSDIKIINTLSKDYRLSNGVINVIIDFVLSKNNNILSRAFAEKIAASFNREEITTTVDAMNYCNRVINSHKKTTNNIDNKDNNNKDDLVKEDIDTNKDNQVADDNWDDLFAQLDGEVDNGKTDD